MIPQLKLSEISWLEKENEKIKERKLRDVRTLFRLETEHKAIKDKLKEVQDEIKILQTYDSSLSFIFLSAKVTFSMMEEHNLA